MADADQLPDEMVITLRKPITLGDLTCAELHLREPTAGEWLQWAGLTGTEADIKAVSVVSGVPKSVIEKIGARDLMVASRYLGRFLS